MMAASVRRMGMYTFVRRSNSFGTYFQVRRISSIAERYLSSNDLRSHFDQHAKTRGMDPKILQTVAKALGEKRRKPEEELINEVVSILFPLYKELHLPRVVIRMQACLICEALEDARK